MLSDMEKYTIKYFSTVKINIIKDDYDNKFLELAETL